MIEVTIWCKVGPDTSRQVDLLDMQDELEKLLEPKIKTFGVGSFENIAWWVYSELAAKFPTLSRIQIDADRIEGAVLDIEELP